MSSSIVNSRKTNMRTSPRFEKGEKVEKVHKLKPPLYGLNQSHQETIKEVHITQFGYKQGQANHSLLTKNLAS